MPGPVLEGLEVLDLSWGIAGPMATMLLADHGASVTRIEPPGGDPFRTQLGYRTWQRGKRSAVLDLKTAADRDCLLALARTADVLVESFAPGVTARLGIDYARLRDLNPRLIYCSITAYGRDNPHSQRPGYDALVAARTGLHFEQRGWPEGAINHMGRRSDPFPDIDVPWEWMQGPPRPGPVFPASHWPSRRTSSPSGSVPGSTDSTSSPCASGSPAWLQDPDIAVTPGMTSAAYRGARRTCRCM